MIIFFNYQYLINYCLNNYIKIGFLNTIFYIVTFLTVNITILGSFLILVYIFLGSFITKLCISLLYLTAVSIKYFQDNFSIFINANIIEGIIETNIALSKEMLSFELISKMIIAILLLTAIFLLVKIKKTPLKARIKLLLQSITLLSAIILMVYLFYFKNEKAGNIRDQTISSIFVNSNPMSIAFAYRQYLRRRNDFSKLNYSLNNIQPFKIPEKNNDLKIVIVIGESARSDNFFLNGYHRNTNPRLANMENLFSFKNVTSCSTSTKLGIHCIINTPERAKVTLNLTTILNSLNFKTNIFSLQNYGDIYSSWNIDNIMTKYDFIAKTTTKIYDSILVENLRKIYKNYNGKQVFILHTLGSHAVYSDRYPVNFAQFTPVCKYSNLADCNLQHLINAYDNTIIFTDHILAEIISILKDDNTILFYISDHGESLGEKGIFTHAMPKQHAPHEQFHIPFIIWVSTKFSEKNPEILSALKSNLEKKITQRNFFHSVLDCISADNGVNVKKSLSVCQNSLL